MINSKTKGKVGEREVAELLRSYGFKARRGQQFEGGSESPDVVSDDFPFHIEVKRTEHLSIWKACQQAETDAEGDPWVVFHRANGTDWVVIMPADTFLEYVKAKQDGRL